MIFLVPMVIKMIPILTAANKLTKSRISEGGYRKALMVRRTVMLKMETISTNGPYTMMEMASAPAMLKADLSVLIATSWCQC
jgi:hypothetical protein